MAGIQLGDLVQVSKAIWEIYQYGWSESLNATTQYAQFGSAVRGLADSLDSLIRMLTSAHEQIRSGLGPRRAPTWNFASLNEIIGDYQNTIYDCRRLLLANRQYGQNVGPLRNIEWNVLIQPQAKLLQERLLLHNSKILIIIKPLEIDLLSQIISKIDAVHGRVEEVYGLLTSNVPQAVRQQEQQLSYTLECPPDVVARFRRAAESSNLGQRRTASRPLSELAEALLLHLRQSTIDFQPGRTFEPPVAPSREYLSLLKCVWLMGQIEEHQDLYAENTESHWPSYIKGLKLELSRECWRFNPRCPDPINAPDISGLNNSDYFIWPTRTPESILPPIVQLPAAMMDELLDVTLASPRPSLLQQLRLLCGPNGKMSAIISAVDYDGEDERRDSRTLDFSIENSGLVPLYAVSFEQGPLSLILRTESTMAEITFRRTEELLRFQRAMTGFKVYQEYSQPSVMLEFIMADRKVQRVHAAHVQLWISKELEGRASTGADSTSDDSDSLSRRLSSVSRLSSPSSLHSSGNINNRGNNNGGFLSQTQNNADPLISRLGHLNISNVQNLRGNGRSPSGSSDTIRESMFSRSPPTNSFPPGGVRGHDGINRQTSFVSFQTTPSVSNTTRESLSVFSAASKTSHTASTVSKKITTLENGSGRGYLHQKPVEPMLVLLLKAATTTSQPATAPFSVVAIQLDEKTSPNYERCRCQSHPDQCDITALERDKGKEDLMARIVEADELTTWDLMRFRPPTKEDLYQESSASSKPKPLPKLRRVTLKFPDAESRYRFSGRPCSCRTKTTGELMACLRDKHQGYLGELKQLHRKELGRFEDAQRKKKDVMLGPMNDG